MSTPLSITVPDHVEGARGVRFDDECILIPGPQPRSRMTKLLAKPSAFIFKRKPSPQDPHPPISPRDYDAPQSPTSPKSALSRKFSLNEGKSPSPYIQRRSSLPPSSRAHHTRASSSSLPSTPLVTIPLRPCCPNCFSATENAVLQGDNWIENFTRPARRRRSLSTDNRPCPPHLLASTSGTMIQWSTRAENAPPPSSSTFRSIVVDEVDGKVATHTDDVTSGSDGHGTTVTEVRNGLDHLSVRDPEDNVLPPLLSRQKQQKQKAWLSPIPSNNPSEDDLSPTDAAGEDVDSSSPASDSFSPPSSPMLPTPTSSVTPTPTSSPTISQRGSETSPRMPGSFRIPKRGALLRAGSDILKGVSVLGSSPV